jgi:hypothetical protein
VSALRIVAIMAVLVLSAFAWMTLGASLDIRTQGQDASLREKVGDLWGTPQTQKAPTFYAPGGKGSAELPILGTDVRADLKSDQRRKGLLWYATYGVDFRGTYRVRNSAARQTRMSMVLLLPAPGADYDGFAVTVDGRPVETTFGGGTATTRFETPAGGTATVDVRYRTQGLDSWSYAASGSGPDAIRDFSLTMSTDFTDVDFPDGAVSPTAKRRTPAGWELTWKYDSLVSGRPIALTMPKPLNPGPIASRISYFAPVGLLFFFATLVLLTATRGLRVHPMNYAFLAGGFFAFHLLFAYLADQVDINVAFAAAAITSMTLCVGYLWLALGRCAALVEAAVAQLIFLVLFSYSFFFEGYTGLTITIGAIVTLAYFMARTGRTDWDGILGREKRMPYAPPPVPGPQPVAPSG